MATHLNQRRLLSRRGLFKTIGAITTLQGFGVVGRGATFIRPARPQSQGSQLVYSFNPEWGAGAQGCPVAPGAAHQVRGCHGCTACHKHAANKRFASYQAADTGRAHPFCHCLIESQAVSFEEYVRMFGVPGTPNQRSDFDLRWIARLS